MLYDNVWSGVCNAHLGKHTSTYKYYVPVSSKWTIACIKKAGKTEDSRHTEISTTFPHQAATPKHQMLKWRHHSTIYQMVN